MDPGAPVVIAFQREGFRIIQVGCGGTGGYVVPDVARLIYSLQENIPYTLIDGDTVEQKNIVRQNFVPSDVGRNKAEVISARYGPAYGIDISYIPEYAESGSVLERAGINDNSIPILIGAVDNTRTRQLLQDAFHSVRNVIYIDAGNGETDGQAALGFKMYGDTILAPPGDIFPDLILGEKSLFPSQVISCADAAITLPQTLCANRTAATTILWFLHGLLVGKRLAYRSIIFDFTKPYFRAIPITYGMVGSHIINGIEVLPA